MTICEAKSHFGLKDTDRIMRDGLLAIKDADEKRLKTWSLGTADKVALRLEIEACNVLLIIAE